MAQVTITQLPAASPLTGTESVPISQNGQTVQTTVAAIANSPTQQQTFITVNQEVTLPNSRSLQGGTGVGLTDTGAQGSISIFLNAASGSLEASSNGMIAKTSGSTVTGRTITGSSTGVSVTNGNGVAGNPVIALTGAVGSINGLAGSGLLTLQNGASVGSVSIQGTTNQIDVANSDGLSGNPTVGLANNPVVPGNAGMVLPTGTTGQRPSGTNGQVRYNSTTNRFEGYQNGVWQNVGVGDGSVTSVDVSGGATGLTTSGGPVTVSGTITLGGALLTSSGGTGLTSYTAGDLPYYAAGTAFNKLGISPGTYILTSSGTAPQWTAPSTITVGNATDAVNATTSVNLNSGLTNQIPYQLSPGSTGFMTAPTITDTFLKWNGSAFAWSPVSGAGTVTSVDVSGGTTGLTTSGGPIIAAGTITLAGTLNVANGGTGATTLTGYVKGNGTSAMTASATIPNTDITGLGTMSTQAASSVAITGGNINGTIIGGTTPAAGTFTSVAMTSGTITTPPSTGNDIVNKTYADSIASGINFHQSVKYATTTALPAVTYTNGTGGVGATLTANANGALTVDGYTFTSPSDDGTRILIKNQASQLQNGVYTLTQAGNSSPGAPFILTRATDFDSAGSGVDQIDAGDFFLVTAGTANANTSWVQQTPLPITVGTTAIVFSQFGAPIVYSAGTGLSESPSYTFNIANTTVAAGNYGGAATAVTLSINAQGQITSAADASIAIAGSQITSGTVGVAYGGTGQTTFTDGQLLIGNSTGNTLTKSTLTAGSGISITNGAGSITIAATGGGGGGGGSDAFAWFIS